MKGAGNLHGDKTSILSKRIVTPMYKHIQLLRSYIRCWATEVDAGSLSITQPFVFVLHADYNFNDHEKKFHCPLSIDFLGCRDRFVANALREVKTRRIGGYKLQTYLVKLKASFTMYGPVKGKVRYSIERATTLGGITKAHIAQKVIVVEEGVPQGEKFEDERGAEGKGMRKVTRTRAVSEFGVR